MIDLTYSNNIVTADDYLQARGVDLKLELASVCTSDVGDKAVPQFINQVEEYIIDKYSSLPYVWDGERSNMTDFQKKCFKKAVIYQIDYIREHPEIITESGVSQNGVFIDYNKLLQLGTHPMCHTMMKKGGMANYKIKGCGM